MTAVLEGVMTALPLYWFIDVHSLHAPAGFSFEANRQELEAIKRYAQVEDLTSFKAELKVVPLQAGKFRLTGQLSAEAVQASVVDLSAVRAPIEESFTVEFWPQDLIDNPDGETVSLEVDPPEAIVAGRIPIGDFLCEFFSVSLDPYPRNKDDAFEWNPAESEPEASPFAELARLRQKKPDEG